MKPRKMSRGREGSEAVKLLVMDLVEKRHPVTERKEGKGHDLKQLPEPFQEKESETEIEVPEDVDGVDTPDKVELDEMCIDISYLPE